MKEYILFLDESGDHSLSNINHEFPVFVLTGLLVDKIAYEKICNDVDELKTKFFNTTEAILHSRDIRKCEGAFQILFDLEIKKKFYTDLNKILSVSEYLIVASAINKEKHVAQYGRLADDPYEIALTFVMERVVFEADQIAGPKSIKVVIEGRGKKEDEKLAKRYNELLYRGTGKVDSQRLLSVFSEELVVKKKRDNDCGLQLSDLCAYPIARYVMNNEEPNPAFDIIKPKIRRGPRGFIGYGIKIFPSR